jgi:protein-tyrosine phosphatase
MRDKAKALGLDVFVDSAGTHAHTGWSADRRSAIAAKTRGYDLSDLRARAVTQGDFEDFDLILCMDQGHKLILERVAPKEYHHKIRMFDTRDVGDPYYGGDQGFEVVLDQIEAAVERLIESLDLKKP